jgi:hypothetical protein
VTLELLERAAAALEPVLSDVVFLGGASIVLWITDPGAPAPRPTKDVDVVVGVTSRTAFHAFDGREELPGEVQGCEPELRAYLASELTRLSAHPRFREGVSGALRGDSASQARAEAVVLPRIEQLVGEPRT